MNMVNNNSDKEVKEEVEGFDEHSSESWGDYPLDTVFVRKEPRTVGDIVTRINKGRYKLDPEFQRDFVWNLTMQARLIESSLMRIPLPVLYVAEDLDGRIIVVDGLQRLTTFQRFLNDEFALKGIGSSDPDSLISGKKFSELPIHLQERIEDTQLTLYILDPKAPERARLDIFERVNSGKPLTRQQMRNCLYSGVSTRWLKEASEHQSFLSATGKSLNSKSMRDREVINRFCAFYVLGYESYEGDMEEFLADALSKMNKMSSSELELMMNAFCLAMDLNYELFGKHSFRKSLIKKDRKSVLNVSLFDAIASQLALNIEKVEQLPTEDLIKRVCNLLKYEPFINAISNSTNNSNQVKVRHLLAENTFSSSIDIHPDAVIYQDIIKQFFIYRFNSVIASSQLSDLANSFIEAVSSVSCYVDWKVREELLAEVKFNFVSNASRYSNIPEVEDALVSLLLQQSKKMNSERKK